MFTKFIQKAFFISLLSIQQAPRSVLRQILQALFLKATLNALSPTALVRFPSGSFAVKNALLLDKSAKLLFPLFVKFACVPSRQ